MKSKLFWATLVSAFSTLNPLPVWANVQSVVSSDPWTALNQILPVGTYNGHNSFGENCEVIRTPNYLSIVSNDVRGDSHQVWAGFENYIKTFQFDNVGNFAATLAMIEGQGSESGPIEVNDGVFTVTANGHVDIESARFGQNNCNF